MDEEEDHFKSLVLDTFAVNTKLLSWLKKNCLLRPVAPVGCGEHFPYFREGQNDIIRKLITIVEEAINGRID